MYDDEEKASIYSNKWVFYGRWKKLEEVTVYME